jgi:hypothetical protein
LNFKPDSGLAFLLPHGNVHGHRGAQSAIIGKGELPDETLNSAHDKTFNLNNDRST